MVELEIQKFKRAGGTDEELTEKYAINVKPHPDYPNLKLLKYDQISSDFSLELVRDCRGIILDYDRNYEVVCLSFRKFFNYSEGGAAIIDWPTAKVQAKADGSLCQLFYYDDKWHVATSGTPNAGGDVNGFGITFERYFWDTFAKYKQELPTCDSVCFAMELCGPINRIVVQHKEPHLTLLGARNLNTLDEIPVTEASEYLPNIPVIKHFRLGSIEDVVASFGNIPPTEGEGYVCVDSRFNRIKCKTPQYVALHALKGGMSRRAIVEIVRQGETSEIEAAFPEFAEMLEECRSRFSALVSDCERDMSELACIPVQKDFAMQAVHKRCPGALFSVRAGKYPDFRHYFANGLHLDNLISTLGYKAAEVMPGGIENPQNAPGAQ